MWTEYKALLKRYYTTYFRVPKRLLVDSILGIIIGGALALMHLNILGPIAGTLYILTLPFTFLVTVRTMLGEIVSEKSSGIKEYLKLNGLSIYVYQLYLITVTAIKTSFFTLFIIIGTLVGALLQNATNDDSGFNLKITAGQTIVIYVLTALASISFVLLITTLFSDAKVASSIGALMYGAISLFSNVVFTSSEPLFYYLTCLFPQSALTISISYDVVKKNPPNISRENINWIVLAEFFVYMTLYVYFDQVIKDDNGVRKPFLFFLDVFRSKKKAPVKLDKNPVTLSINLPGSQNDLSAYIDKVKSDDTDYSSAMYHETIPGAQNLNKAVQVRNLTKTFEDFTAVDDISFPIYQGQIFCLLGHNGAGKTTTIKMMTGLLDIDGGNIIYDGKDFMENFEEVRTKIGICTQNDILFEKLKVFEHLELVAKLRHIPDNKVASAVEEALHKVNLVNERDKFALDLSGGNKRKLSLAMAVLGQTKVVFLDEPTSGMDPQNRRVMWYHLKELKKEGLTILLTTHHLDEADELADRVAIMSKGKLLALGTSEFFKKNFGVGYHLNLTPKYDRINLEGFNQLRPKLQSMISKVVPASKFDEQTALDVLKCTLPFTTQKDFPRLFAELENFDEVRISVEINTLEDVFVNIGLHEDQLLQGKEPVSTNVDLSVEPPACLSERPTYNFFSQTFALAKRRTYILCRSGRNIFLMVLPLVLILVGVVSTLGFSNNNFKFAFFQTVTIISFSLNTGSYVYLPVYEREDKLKYLMDVMGLRNLPYWIGNVIVDFIATSLINFVVFGLYAWFYSVADTSFTTYPTPLEFLAVAVPHGFCLVTIGYAYNFIFDKALSAIKYFPLFYFFVLFMAGMFGLSEAGNLNGPPGTQRLGLGGLVSIICPSCFFLIFQTGQLASLGVGTVALFEIGYGLFYFVIAVVLGSGKVSVFTQKVKQGFTAPEQREIPIDLKDINNEKNRALQAEKDPIRVLGLSKTYDNGYTAVRDVTFGVEPGQIFGLLGPNGAGKSTTFNIITAAIPKSEGSVQLLGHEVGKKMPEVYENVGICPQFDGLWGHLTVREHLILFGNLKGLKGPNLEKVIDYYLDALHLRAYENKQAGKLSGGNKRKLGVANSFIGSAYLLFLDEPSTGVDPLSRRFLWNSIQQVLKLRQASVVLTTHSMYEAESLSHKIGILINGRFVCIGPTQYLKEKYSQGYKITVNLIQDGPNPMQKVMELFPEAEKIHDSSSIQQTFNIPFKGFRFSEAFKKLDRLKEENMIKDFSIYNTTLEQIFIYFSSFQINPEDD